MAKRILKEIKNYQNEENKEIILKLVHDDDLFHWNAWILGPPDTPYENAYFKLNISVPSDYPLHPPTVKFETKVFHPNVHFKTGEICLDLLKNQWSAIYTLQSICRAIISLLAHPEAESPLNCDCGNLLRSGDIRGYASMAKMYTKLYASPTPDKELKL